MDSSADAVGFLHYISLKVGKDMEEEKQNFNSDIAVSVKISVMDMYYFMMRHTYSAFSGWFGIVLSLVSFILLIIGVGRGDRILTGVLIILSLLFTVINPVLLFIKSWKQVILNPMFQKPISYGFGKEGIEITQEEEWAGVRWDEVVKTVFKKKHIIIYMSRIRAFILPIGQFENEYPRIAEMIKENVREGKNGI